MFLAEVVMLSPLWARSDLALRRECRHRLGASITVSESGLIWEKAPGDVAERLEVKWNGIFSLERNFNRLAGWPTTWTITGEFGRFTFLPDGFQYGITLPSIIHHYAPEAEVSFEGIPARRCQL